MTPRDLAERHARTCDEAKQINAMRAEKYPALYSALVRLVEGCKRQVGGFDALDELDEAERVLSQ